MTPRRAYCEACGYTESHDPNCPREPTEFYPPKFYEWIEREFPRATGYEIDFALTVWLGALAAEKEALDMSDTQSLLTANETLQSALRVIVDSLAPTMSFWGEDLPGPVAVGYARGAAIRALEEVANA